MFCLLAALMPASVLATVTDLPRVSGAISVDGVLDEAVWQLAARIDVNLETNPGENLVARVQTTAYLFEDGENLYIAFDARDPDPSAIRAYLRDRDSAWNDDFVGIVLDTYNDQRRAFEFFSNSLGVQMDLTNDDVNKNEDESWDAIWDSAGKINGDGYVVEMEIPLNQLRFPSMAGKQAWGIELLRFYPRDHRYRFSSNRFDRSLNCYLCQFNQIQGLESVEPGRDLEMVPTLTAAQSENTDDPGVEPMQRGGTRTDAGISIRWGISPDLTANLAINPDFSQIEADAPQLDVNNQFALFFPEKRPFFLEGADYFSTPIDAVFTRTVADPSVGVKLSGKRDNNTFGVFAAQDDLSNLIFPGAYESDSVSLEQKNTVFVGRYSRSFGDTSSVGALLTARDGDEYQNVLGGLDTRWKINDQHSVQAQYLNSRTEYPVNTAAEFDQPLGSFTGDALTVTYDYDSRDWFGYLKHDQKSKGFRADSGFVPQVDVNTQVVGLGHIWYGDEENWWTRARLLGEWDITHGDGGQVLEREVEARFGIGGPMQSWIQIGGLTRDILFDAVRFTEKKVSFYTEFQPKGGLALGLFTRYGDQVDFANTQLGDLLEIQPFFSWNVSRKLLLKVDSTILRMKDKAGPSIFDAEVYDVRLTWQFSRRSFLRLTTQYQSVDKNPDEYIDPVDSKSRDVGRQLLYSYKINPQTVFFLGYSDQHIDDDGLENLTVTDRTVFMKIGYAWTP
jgi:hypothetical protein